MIACARRWGDNMESRWPVDPMPLSRATLAEAVAEGATPSYLCFPDWGGAAPLGWLAPWTPTPFVTADGSFGSAEHHLMRGKALLFDDGETAARILRAKSPAQARELGRRVRGFHEATWIAERQRIMDGANRAKFHALPDVRAYLLSTWPNVLVQASALDTTWGAGLDLDDHCLPKPGQWPGENLVGFSLMRVRGEFRTR
jgi:ribA/ribD-fused uncharacterized protein